MEPVEKKNMILLPPAPGLCQVCAVDHDPTLPHNAQSFYYQTKFNMENGRSANWKDAMAHCTDEMKTEWLTRLKEMGVDAEKGEVNPKKRGH